MEGGEDKGKYGWDEGGSVGCSERCEVCSRVAETSSKRGEERRGILKFRVSTLLGVQGCTLLHHTSLIHSTTPQ